MKKNTTINRLLNINTKQKQIHNIAWQNNGTIIAKSNRWWHVVATFVCEISALKEWNQVEEEKGIGLNSFILSTTKSIHLNEKTNLH